MKIRTHLKAYTIAEDYEKLFIMFLKLNEEVRKHFDVLKYVIIISLFHKV